MMKIIILICLVLFCVEVEAKTKIKNLNFSSQNNKGEIIIQTKGKLEGNPEIFIKDNILQVSVGESFVWPKIDKKIKVLKSYDTTLMAYQFDKDIVRIRAILPYSMKGFENQVSLQIEDDKILLHFPVIKQKTIKMIKSTKTNLEKSSYDEKYLEKLLEDSGDFKAKNNILDLTKTKPQTDQISQINSSTFRGSSGKEKEFSIWSYVLKFLAFLGVILVGFYGIIIVMRKGVMKKGRLGFFNTSNLVEVLSTTHVGPKKSLLLVKAHKQVFLVSSTDKGMEFLSEINDVSGLIKNGEKETLGNNFDTSLDTEIESKQEFKLKDDLYEADTSTYPQRKPKNKKIKSSSKYSDQIKKKLKNLKPLQ